MGQAPVGFTANELKRATRCLQEAGLKIVRVDLTKGKVQFITADHPDMAVLPPAPAELDPPEAA
jgi:hypothetical protein